MIVSGTVKLNQLELQMVFSLLLRNAYLTALQRFIYLSGLIIKFV